LSSCLLAFVSGLNGLNHAEAGGEVTSGNLRFAENHCDPTQPPHPTAWDPDTGTTEIVNDLLKSQTQSQDNVQGQVGNQLAPLMTDYNRNCG